MRRDIKKLASQVEPDDNDLRGLCSKMFNQLRERHQVWRNASFKISFTPPFLIGEQSDLNWDSLLAEAQQPLDLVHEITAPSPALLTPKAASTIGINENEDNLYERLGLDRHASYGAINKAYKEAMLKYHPQLVQSGSGVDIEWAQLACRRVIIACLVLGDPGRRQAYHEGRRAAWILQNVPTGTLPMPLEADASSNDTDGNESSQDGHSEGEDDEPDPFANSEGEGDEPYPFGNSEDEDDDGDIRAERISLGLDVSPRDSGISGSSAHATKRGASSSLDGGGPKKKARTGPAQVHENDTV